MSETCLTLLLTLSKSLRGGGQSRVPQTLLGRPVGFFERRDSGDRIAGVRFCRECRVGRVSTRLLLVECQARAGQSHVATLGPTNTFWEGDLGRSVSPLTG